MTIANECMVVNCCIGLWAGHRLDKEASRRVTDEAQAETDAARVNKHVIPKESLKNIQTLATQIRAHFYKHTLPWKDNGDRLLTRKMFQSFMTEHSKLREQFNTEVNQFLEQGYPQARAKAAFRMGALFDPNDYPSEQVLRKKFYVSLDIDPVATEGDFRVKLDKEHEQMVKQQIEGAMAERINRAVGDAWKRLHDTLSNFAERMAAEKEEGKRVYFKDATIDNLHEIVELLPAFNVLDDPKLAALAKDIKHSLLGYSAKELREDEELRGEISGEAQRILADMSGFMNAFKEAA